MGIGGHVNLRKLAEQIRTIEERHESTVTRRFIDEPANDRVPTGWAEIDAVLGGGLSASGLHEWFGVEKSGCRRWSPPLCILAHLAWQAFKSYSWEAWTIWIGKPCHPYPRVLIRDENQRLLDHSLFVAPRDAASRLWAIDLALRSPAIGCVIADGSGFDRAATQRIQLLARTQTKLVLAACPSKQRDELSAAQTRWHVSAIASVRNQSTKVIRPRWNVELLRCKGMRPTQSHPAWLLEWNRAEGSVHLSSQLADLAGSSEKQTLTAPRQHLRQRSA